ncbi:hypothetical protein D1AOALGA4SA_11145 [Olavius algarvensis Delta 1 endosymbiont]|nr:hypothetical protein D1AOALGA4SA_11145 [Olavius algarvensis Delta 1 endosymbiont]
MAVGLFSKLFQKVTYKICKNKSMPFLIESVFTSLVLFRSTFGLNYPFAA